MFEIATAFCKLHRSFIELQNLQTVVCTMAIDHLLKMTKEALGGVFAIKIKKNNINYEVLTGYRKFGGKITSIKDTKRRYIGTSRTKNFTL